MRDSLYTLVLSMLFAFGTHAQQTPKPVATPSATPATKKVNERPGDKAAAAEPFDRVSVQAMATRCVNLSTEIGDIYLEVYPESAPESVRNFLNLVILGAYDGTTFSRVVPGFVIQGGNIFTREGSVTPELAKRAGHTIVDEPNKILHERGIVSMARPEEPDQASTHFFILVQAAPSLDGKYAAFGRVLRGMELVDAMNKAAVEGEKPLKAVRIRKATVDECVRPSIP
jgi:peptidyl-prolyl cis-trans isomerase B (cyclophilin B)